MTFERLRRMVLERLVEVNDTLAHVCNNDMFYRYPFKERDLFTCRVGGDPIPNASDYRRMAVHRLYLLAMMVHLFPTKASRERQYFLELERQYLISIE